MEPTNIPLDRNLDEPSQVELLGTESNNDYWQLSANPLSGRTQYGQQSTPLTGGHAKLEASLGYRRCFDFDPTNSSGQDYAIVRGNQHYVAGVLADGVSQSYYGNLAAGHLSEHLLQFLWGCRQRPVALEEMDSVLKQLETEGQKLVDLHRSPDHLPAMHREALNRSRGNGSQTVFSAFVLDTKSQDLTVYQVGDVDAVVVQLGTTTVVRADAQGRWSTAGKSQHLLRVTAFEDVHSLLIRSDGFGSAWEEMLHQGSNQRCQFFEHLAAKQAGKDDVSFILIKVLAEARPVPGSKKVAATGTVEPRRAKLATSGSGRATAERLESAVADERGRQRLWRRGLRIRATLAALGFFLIGSAIGCIGGVFWASESKYPGQLIQALKRQISGDVSKPQGNPQSQPQPSPQQGPPPRGPQLKSQPDFQKARTQLPRAQTQRPTQPHGPQPQTQGQDLQPQGQELQQ